MTIRHFVALSALALVAGGCIPQEKYNALKIERDQLNDRLAMAQNRVSEAEAKAASWKSQLDILNQSGGNSTALVANYGKQVADLQAQLSDITAKYNDAINKIGSGPALPIALTNELTTFADQNPDLVEFDAKKGTVKFKSDVTFASGDAALTPAAAEVISRFARILNSPAASGYELMVAGHADNQAVSAPTAARGHRDNWYLSAHRAISVAEALRKQNVSGKRLAVVGYADQRPVASNDTREGKAMNRRVEVLILPSQITAIAAPIADKPAVTITKPADAGLNK
jgi:chemotaxis protein MotB